MRSANPADAPLIRFNYYGGPDGLEQMVDGVEKTGDLVARSVLVGLRGAAITPDAAVQTRGVIRANSKSDFHPCGTCRMGTGDDAVVDRQGRSNGAEGLRVATMPAIPSGNLNGPVQMMAAGIADDIAQRPAERADHVLNRSDCPPSAPVAAEERQSGQSS